MIREAVTIDKYDIQQITAVLIAAIAFWLIFLGVFYVTKINPFLLIALGVVIFGTYMAIALMDYKGYKTRIDARVAMLDAKGIILDAKIMEAKGNKWRRG